MNDETSEPTSPVTATDDAETYADDTVEEHRGIGGVRGGIAIALVGALMLVVGMLSTTSSHGGNAECPDGTVLVSKFNYTGGKYVFEKPSGNQNVVTISEANAKGGIWTSTTAISAIIVKGGPGSKTTTLTPPQTSGTFSNKDLPEVGRGNTPDISNLQFCGPKTPVTTTTASTTTSTTVKPTTSTTSTTTTTSTTSTTSTSVAPPTTQPSTTTTESTTTTSEAPPTTQPSTTTTESTTTSEAPPTTQPSTTTTESTTTTSEAPPTTQPTTSSSVAPSTSEATTSTVGPEVSGEVIVKTSITPDDAAVAGNSVSRALAFTGGASIPLVVLGIVLLLAGGTLALVTRSRQRQAEA